MKHEHSKIRDEAAVLYALAHPEVKLMDIGLAMGFDLSTAKSAISYMLRKAGHSRPLGAGSKAYDHATLLKNAVLRRKYDHEAILAHLKEHPDEPQRDTAKKFGCHQSTVSTISIENGLGVGKGYRSRHGRRLKTDEEIVAFLKLHPEMNISQVVIALGYKMKSSYTWERVKRLKAQMTHPRTMSVPTHLPKPDFLNPIV